MGQQSLIDQPHFVCGMVKCDSPKGQPLFSKLNEHDGNLGKIRFKTNAGVETSSELPGYSLIGFAEAATLTTPLFRK